MSMTSSYLWRKQKEYRAEKLRRCSIPHLLILHVHVVVQFYSCFPLFQTHYQDYHIPKQRKIKFKPQHPIISDDQLWNLSQFPTLAARGKEAVFVSWQKSLRNSTKHYACLYYRASRVKPLSALTITDLITQALKSNNSCCFLGILLGAAASLFTRHITNNCPEMKYSWMISTCVTHIFKFNL